MYQNCHEELRYYLEYGKFKLFYFLLYKRKKG
jgi:hypothetical protein